MKKVLITGINGFTGKYLACELKNAGYDVHGIVRDKKNLADENYTCHTGDISNVCELLEILKFVKPAVVIHLAGISFVAHGDANAIFQSNLIGSHNLLEALVESRLTFDSILLASSSNVYGNVVDGILDELTPTDPANIYAISKLGMEQTAKLYNDKLPIIIARPFNYTGVGQADRFLIPKIVAHISQKKATIELGNLDVTRDFSDVRSIVQAYRGLIEAPRSIGQIVNVCSENGWSLRDVVAVACDVSGHSLEIQVNPKFVRHNEVKTLLGSRKKLDSLISVRNNYKLPETIKWMLDQ